MASVPIMSGALKPVFRRAGPPGSVQRPPCARFVPFPRPKKTLALIPGGGAQLHENKPKNILMAARRGRDAVVCAFRDDPCLRSGGEPDTD